MSGDPSPVGDPLDLAEMEAELRQGGCDAATSFVFARRIAQALAAATEEAARERALADRLYNAVFLSNVRTSDLVDAGAAWRAARSVAPEGTS